MRYFLCTTAVLITVVHVHSKPSHHAPDKKPVQSDFWKNYGCKLSVVACLPRGWKEKEK